MLLRALHLIGIVGWLGSAAADIVLEAVLKRSRSATEQRVLMRLHSLADTFVEGPGLLLAGISGALLLEQGGFFAPGVAWPTWFKWKIGAGLTVLATNTFALVCVTMRHRKARLVPEGQLPLEDPAVKLWVRLTFLTWIGIPFAVVAVVLAGLHLM